MIKFLALNNSSLAWPNLNIVLSMRNSDESLTTGLHDAPGLGHRDQIGPRVQAVAVSAQSGMFQRRKRNDGVELFQISRQKLFGELLRVKDSQLGMVALHGEVV